MTPNPSETILSIDLGRTSTKACISRDPSEVLLIPANVAHLEVDQVRRGGDPDDLGEGSKSSVLLDLWVEYQGRGYAIGQFAEDFGANLGVGQSKVDDALVKTLACAGYFGLEQPLNLVVGLPYPTQEQFDREKAQLIASLKGSHNGSHNLSFRGKPVRIDLDNIWVVPEGYGSLVWCQYMAQEQGRGPDFTPMVLAIVDIGHQTTDFLMVNRARFARGASKSLSEIAMSEFYKRVASQIKGADSQSLYFIEKVSAPPGERFYRPRGARQPTDLDEILPSLQKSFARELSDRLLDWLPDRVTDVILSGGGGEFFAESLKPLLAEAGLTTHIAQPSRLANALGQWLYGAARTQPLTIPPVA